MHKMSMIIKAHSKEKLKVEDIGIVTFGGFCFVVGDDDIPFDFEAFGTAPKQREDGCVDLIYTAGRGLVFNEYTLDPCYTEQLADEGIDINDITAKFLSEVVCIYELYYELYHKEDLHEESCLEIIIDDIIMVDLDDWDNPIEYKVSQAVIDAFNGNTVEA